METDRTLLQEIRKKEQEVGEQVAQVKAEAEALVAAARSEAEDLLCTADKAAKVTAEQVYWKERSRTEAEIEDIRRVALLEGETLAMKGESNLSAAIDRIVRYVTME
jgi:vacuolar-type H+-ATPase subunit H